MIKIGKGTYSTIESLYRHLTIRLVPKWYEAFCDKDSYGFYERLGHSFQPIFTGQRRLLTHCRQLAIYSHASILPETQYFSFNLEKHFNHVERHYYNKDNRQWIFSTNDLHEPLNTDCDFYTMAFVIFAMAHYFKATNDHRAKIHAENALHTLNDKFLIYDNDSKKNLGYAEFIDFDGKIPDSSLEIRRQNPHMHLFEACIVAYETWGEDIWLESANEMATLFKEKFYDSENKHLAEYYNQCLSPHLEKGHISEPGHYFEWIWLLKKYSTLEKSKIKIKDEIFRSMFDFAFKYGWDSENGGIFDETDESGNVIKDSKRLWPFTEALKACVLMLNGQDSKQKKIIKKRLNKMTLLFNKKYMKERGFWTEWLSGDLLPETSYMPGTTPYHVYFGITESYEIIKKRGKNKSLATPIFSILYITKRHISLAIKRIKHRYFLKKHRQHN